MTIEMKRLLFSLLTLIVSLSAFAQDMSNEREEKFREKFPYKYEVRLGWSGYPILEANNFPNRGRSYYEDIDIGYNKYALNDLYGTYQGAEYMTGLISGEFSIHFRRWFTLAVEAGFNGMWGYVYHKTDGSLARKTSGVSFTVLPHARFYWLNCKNIRFYSGVGLGVGLGQYDKDFAAYPAFQLSPVGFTAGREFFFFGETSLGTAYLGGKFGVGYRF